MITTHLSTHLMSCHEVEIHYKRPLFSDMKMITCADDVIAILRTYINPKLMDVKEYFWILFLTRSNRLLGIATTGCGDAHGVIVNIKEIFQLTLCLHASQIIIAHNHPSGKLVPSSKDKEITKKIKEGAKLFDVTLLDHLIVTSESYLSFAEQSLI